MTATNRILPPATILADGLAVSLVLFSGAHAQQQKADQGALKQPDITVQVAGLSCPFCAYGLEKKMKNLEGVSEVGVLLEEGKVQLKLEAGAQLSEKAIQEAVKKAGFEAKNIMFARENARAPESG